MYDELLDLLLGRPSADEILRFRPSASAQARVDELLERNRSGRLSPEDEVQLDEFEQSEHMVRLLKARALRNPGS